MMESIPSPSPAPAPVVAPIYSDASGQSTQSMFTSNDSIPNIFFGKGPIKSRLKTFGHMCKRQRTLEEYLQVTQTTPEVPLAKEHDLSTTSTSEPMVTHQPHLRKCLNLFDLLAFGVGSIIGSGIFVLTGVAARDYAGPAVIFSFLASGFACCLSGLSYAEFATRVPVSGSTYSYSYIVVGEMVAWIIGWDLTLEYMIASATVARGWSGYLNQLIKSFGGSVPHPLDPYYISDSISIDLIAMLSVLVLTAVVAFGMKESARFNKVFVVVKIIVVLFVIIAGSFKTNTNNWTPFTPFGIRGIFNAAAITFFAYLGFDSICNVAEEVEKPQRDIPIGILGSLGISTALYFSVSVVITLMVKYSDMDVNAPLSAAFASYGWKWAEVIVAVGAFAGLTTAQLGGLISQPRLYYSLSRDGLLPKIFSYIHPRFKTPFFSTWLTGICASIIALFFDIKVLADMVSIGTLLSFTLVCACVLAKRYPVLKDRKDSNARWIVKYLPAVLQRPIYLCIVIAIFAAICSAGYIHYMHWSVSLVFGVLGLIPSITIFFLVPCDIPVGFKCPLVPLVPILGIWVNVYLMMSLSWQTWIRLVVWLFIGLLIYIFYGQKHSNAGRYIQMNTFGNTSPGDDFSDDMDDKLGDTPQDKLADGDPTTANANAMLLPEAGLGLDQQNELLVSSASESENSPTSSYSSDIMDDEEDQLDDHGNILQRRNVIVTYRVTGGGEGNDGRTTPPPPPHP
ncbi:hypothetical protein SAMD00019534_086800 [Acytostelium subglobosum LB1]|uniref:hypothetical protein n=1 Tax=Acytostelium subglobosum LB1 TaxID=1410327 RepID=UPI000644CE45|nr:hypothetical protein SAMD00019534_086800 [Acytostelium subglobosum LB1]GAM25505.1 hypothetical protein SAMD00019534_086800 [Acytostelium subglobosum LB1]|eukprot:XP_012751491.1 hypothetical protein SAMD00019534_086800 [Acytostelium subglobosum LB1]